MTTLRTQLRWGAGDIIERPSVQETKVELPKDVVDRAVGQMLVRVRQRVAS